jgi:hypothetical protein
MREKRNAYMILVGKPEGRRPLGRLRRRWTDNIKMNHSRMIKSRRTRCAGHVARMGEKRNAYRILMGKPEGKRPLGRLRRRWTDNTKINLTELGWDGIN